MTRALILNSGIGSRMGGFTADMPKCLVTLANGETILGRQLRQLCAFGIEDIVVTTGFHDERIREYAEGLGLPAKISFVKNERFGTTNYIYSIFLAGEAMSGGDVVLLHGDLVFEDTVLDLLLSYEGSRAIISSTRALPEKDFKAVVEDERILKVGIDYFQDAFAFQPLYKLTQDDWGIWFEEIEGFVRRGETSVYAENALNLVSRRMELRVIDAGNLLCGEIDTREDLDGINRAMGSLRSRTVYLSFSTDIIHSGHIALLNRAARLGSVVVGVLSDRAVAEYKRFPLVSFEQKCALYANLRDVTRVIEQTTLSYRDALLKEKPDIVLHGDDWRSGVQSAARGEVISTLGTYGGCLVEFPYAREAKYEQIENELQDRSALPDVRRSKLRRLLSLKRLVRVIEAHSGLTGLIAERTIAHRGGNPVQFDGMWVSSLCDSTSKGKPDIELVEFTSRLRTVEDILEVTTKPIILDGDTGGMTEHFVHNVRSLERLGVSAIIIEDKAGLKKNSLFGTEAAQTQDTIENFCEKIAAGVRVRRSKDFMLIARIESLILERGMEDALARAHAYVSAGADGIMIHSRRKSPDEIFEFAKRFRSAYSDVPLIVVPTSFNAVTEEEFAAYGINIVIYANHLIRSAFPAMQKTAESILINGRCKEADEFCMPIGEILSLIPEQ